MGLRSRAPRAREAHIMIGSLWFTIIFWSRLGALGRVLISFFAFEFTVWDFACETAPKISFWTLICDLITRHDRPVKKAIFNLPITLRGSSKSFSGLTSLQSSSHNARAPLGRDRERDYWARVSFSGNSLSPLGAQNMDFGDALQT